MRNIENSTPMNVWTTEKVNQLLELVETGKVDLTKVPNPFHDSNPEWRAADIVFEYTPEEREELKKCAQDVLYFADKYCYAMTDDGVQNIKLRDYQQDALVTMQHNNKCVWLASRQIGKAQPLDSRLWTLSGPTRMGDIRLGDQIYGSRGVTTVIGIIPQGEIDIYEVKFSDGSVVKCCLEHLWTVEDVVGNIKTMSTEDLAKNLHTGRGDCKWFVPNAGPIEFVEREVVIDPYVLGLLLGDGCMRHSYLSFATKDHELINAVSESASEMKCVVRQKSREIEYTIVGDSGPNNMIRELKRLGLFGCLSQDKFIPDEYKYGSVEQRLGILRGLLDTDGHITEKSNIEFATASERLANDIQEICETLGIIVRRYTKQTSYKSKDGIKIKCQDSHRLKLQIPNGYPYEIFGLNRKQSKVRDKKYDWGRRRGIESITKVGRENAQCIVVDAPDSLYMTNHCVLTHNTICSGIFLTWYLLFNTDKNLMVLANVGRTTTEIIDKLKVIMKNLPFFMKPGVMVNNQMRMTFDNGCRLIGVATSKTAAIGFAVHFLYVDEFAHIPASYLDPFWRSVYPTLSANKNARCVITSTPNGQNKFYDIYTTALIPKGQPGASEFVPMRVDYWQVPGRDDKWRDAEIANLGSVEDFNQEYGLQFISGSKLLLDTDSMRAINANKKNYEFIRIPEMDDLDLNYDGLRWYPGFDPTDVPDTAQFVWTVDTAGGGGGDYSVINIFMLRPMPTKVFAKNSPQEENECVSAVQVGMFRSNSTSIEDLVRILECLLFKVFQTDNVRVALELDFRGAVVISKISTHPKFYDDIFVHTRHSMNSKRAQIGIKYNFENKYAACTGVRSLVRSGRIVVTEKITAEEFGSFGVDKKGSYSSQVGHDDAAMSVVNLYFYFESDQFYEQADNILEAMPDWQVQQYSEIVSDNLKKQDRESDSGGGLFGSGFMD